MILKNNIFRVRPVLGDLKGLWNTYTIWADKSYTYTLEEQSYGISMWSTLYIKEGINVNFDSYRRMCVYGKLIIQGRSDNPVIFIGNGNGIKIVNGGEVIANYLKIKRADINCDGNAALYVATNGKLDINNSEIDNAYYGINIASGENININNTTIINCDQRGINIDKDSLGHGNVTITNSHISNSLYGIYVNDLASSGIISENNTITDLRYTGIYIYRHQYGDFRVKNNTVYRAIQPIVIQANDISSSLLLLNIENNEISSDYYNGIKLAGILTIDNDLTLPKSKYIYDHIIINKGSTLEIQPGTILLSANGGGIGVYGKLVAYGVKDNPIVLSSTYDPDYYKWRSDTSWGYIYADSIGEINANNMKIKYGSFYIEGSLNMMNCKIMNSTGTGVIFNTDIQPIFHYNTFVGNDIAVENRNDNIMIDASYNYWDSVYGPSIYIPIYNPKTKKWKNIWSGDGDRIIGNIYYEPFLGQEITQALQYNQE